VIVPVLLLAGGFAVFGDRNAGNADGGKTDVPAASVERTAPAYRPLVPSAEKASWTKYDGKRDLVTYTTTFSGARVTVSQQPLPAAFSKDPDALKGAADSISAKQHLDTGNGPLYVATKDDAGDQMAVYAAKDVLLFIHTDRKLDDISWRSFIELLQSKSWDEVSRT
jgi:hypothetical protein